MKITLEIETNDENFSLSDLDWFTLEGGILNKEEYSDDGKIKLFSYFFKSIDLKPDFPIEKIEEGVKGLFIKCSQDILMDKDSNNIQTFEKLEKNLDRIQYEIRALNEKIENLENSRISASMISKSMQTGLIVQAPPPPPPLPPPLVLSSIVLKTNKIITPEKKTEKNPKKPIGPTTAITLDEIKRVKLRKRSEILNRTQ